MVAKGRTFNSIEEMIKACSKEELRELTKAYNDYLTRHGMNPILRR